MVLFSFQGNLNAEERVWDKQISGKKDIRKLYSGTNFFNKYFIEVEELLAIKRIVLMMAFFIHSSIYRVPVCGAQHLLLQATLIFQEWCLTLSPSVVFQSVCGTLTCYSPAIVDGHVCCIIVRSIRSVLWYVLFC